MTDLSQQQDGRDGGHGPVSPAREPLSLYRMELLASHFVSRSGLPVSQSELCKIKINFQALKRIKSVAFFNLFLICIHCINLEVL